MDDALLEIIPCRGLTRLHLTSYVERRGEDDFRAVAKDSGFFACSQNGIPIHELVDRCYFSYKYSSVGLEWRIVHRPHELRFLSQQDLELLAGKIGLDLPPEQNRAAHERIVWWEIRRKLKCAMGQLRQGSRRDPASVQFAFGVLDKLLDRGSMRRPDLVLKLMSQALGAGYRFSKTFALRCIADIIASKGNNIVRHRVGRYWVIGKAGKLSGDVNGGDLSGRDK